MNLSREQNFLGIVFTNYFLTLFPLFLFFIPMFQSLYFLIAMCLFEYVLFRVNSWELSFYYFRYVLFPFVIITTIFNYRHISITQVNAISICLMFISLLLVFLSFKIVLASLKPKQPVTLSFPFTNGTYVVINGGNGKMARLLNYHYQSKIHALGNVNNSMQHAVDIVEIDKNGFSSRNILSDKNESYKIYKEKVYSPCDGQIIAAVDGVDDHAPFSRNYPHSVGNHIVIKNGDTCIILGHLLKGSLKVKSGDVVVARQQIAQIGNNGMSPMPHLHIQASIYVTDYWYSNGIPILFEKNINPIKNKRICMKTAST